MDRVKTGVWCAQRDPIDKPEVKPLMPLPTKTEHRLGLRFDRRDANLLSVLAERARQRELDPSEVKVFAGAAEAARTGEPLIVICTNPLEATLMAAGYVRYGARPPVIEQLGE